MMEGSVDMFDYYVIIVVLALLIIAGLRKTKDEEINSVIQMLPIRGIAAMLVLLSHLFNQYAYMLGHIAVGLFFYFSGYGLMCKACEQKLNWGGARNL